MLRKVGNNHHIWHHRKQHEATPDNEWIRNRALGMIALMSIDTHDALHKECPPVPPLDIFTAARVRRLYQPHPNPLIAIDNMSRAIEDAAEHPRAHQLQIELADLSIRAIRLQIPFIKDGLIRNQYEDYNG